MKQIKSVQTNKLCNMYIAGIIFLTHAFAFMTLKFQQANNKFHVSMQIVNDFYCEVETLKVSKL